MNFRTIVLVFTALIVLSCDNNDNETTTDKTALTLVTGITCRQNFDDAPFTLGNPNVLVDNKFSLYPNPANSISIILAQEEISDVWIVPASAEKIHQDVNFENLFNTSMYNEQTIESSSVFTLDQQSSEQITINIETLERGYYKVFVKIAGEIYWDNLYKYDSDESNEDQFNSLLEFWN